MSEEEKQIMNKMIYCNLVSEEQVCKEIIEQVGYQEFYRYFQEKTTLIEQQRQEIKRLENIIKEVKEYIKDKWKMELKDSIKDFLDHDERIERKRIEHILEILDKGE